MNPLRKALLAKLEEIKPEIERKAIENVEYIWGELEKQDWGTMKDLLWKYNKRNNSPQFGDIVFQITDEARDSRNRNALTQLDPKYS